MDEEKLTSAEGQQEEKTKKETSLSTTKTLTGLYEDWFLDYASYVVLERAVPNIQDGFKPVQRRLLHSMKEMDDGRYNKVANIIGHTMKYHPHGDRSIGDALVQMGQKDLLIDTQGNWGNILTGDSSAAPRYIEARLSKFALEVVFNPKTTSWNLSYDGRNKEPETLPVKFPMLLAMGIEGIAVGMASKILTHNFNELIDASINYLKGKSFVLYPDFITGGLADVSKYNDGLRGGKVRLRAKINKVDNKTLSITEIPFSTNTGSLIDSIVSANDKGKIKIKKIEDNTAENVEIMIRLGSNVSPDQTIDALYAFTKCEESISPNSTVIYNNKPVFLGMTEILKISTDQTVGLLKLELEIRKNELLEKWHFSSLEKIFIKERLYREIEEAESFDEAIMIIDKALDPFKKLFKREITREDIERLTEIKIRRISKYNEFKADEQIKGLEDEIAEVEHHLANIVTFAIDYFKRIKEKFGKGKERKTELRSFDNINAAAVAVNNVKLYMNREEGFIGTSLKKDEFVIECSDIDDIITFIDNGTFMVTKVSDKTFVGKGILYAGVLKKNDDRTIYNLVYRDGKNGGYNYIKRFAVKSVTRDKIYHVTRGTDDSKVLYFSANPNGEAEVIKIKLRPRPKLKKLTFDYDFKDISIKGRSAKGNIITKNIISKISLKEDGVSTLGARDLWFDKTVNKLNVEERGDYLGAFSAEDEILNILITGQFMTMGQELSSHFSDELLKLKKFDEDKVWTAVYFDGDSKYYYIKRFKFVSTDKIQDFITEHAKSKLIHITDNQNPSFEIIFNPKGAPRNRESEIVEAVDFIDEKSYKAKGKRLTNYKVKKINLIESEEEIEDLTQTDNSDEIVNDVDNNDNQQEVESPSIEVLDITDEKSEKESIDNIDTEISDKKVDNDTSKVIADKPIIKEAAKEESKPATKNEEKATSAKADKASVEPKLIPEEEIEVVDKKAKPKKKSSVKKSQSSASSNKTKVSLDDDEPLQMELDL
jgi:topoisomerase-4 subunit A